MDELNLYKETYYNELEVKDKLDLKFSNPFSVYVILIGGMGYIVNKIDSLPDKTTSGIIITMIVAYGLSLVYTGHCLYKAYHRHVYAYVANPILLMQHRTVIEEYYEANYEKFYSNQSESKKELIEKDMYNYLLYNYAEAATRNQNINHYKCGLFLKVGYSLVLNAALWLFAYILTILI